MRLKGLLNASPYTMSWYDQSPRMWKVLPPPSFFSHGSPTAAFFSGVNGVTYDLGMPVCTWSVSVYLKSSQLAARSIENPAPSSMFDSSSTPFTSAVPTFAGNWQGVCCPGGELRHWLRRRMMSSYLLKNAATLRRM